MLTAIATSMVAGLVTLATSTTFIAGEMPSGSTKIPATGSQESIVVTQDDFPMASFLFVDMPPVLPYAGGAGVVLAAAYGAAAEKERNS